MTKLLAGWRLSRIEKTKHMHLNGVVDHICVKILIATVPPTPRSQPRMCAKLPHRRSMALKRELRVFNNPKGDAERISIDSTPYVGGIIVDRIAEAVAKLIAIPDSGSNV